MSNSNNATGAGWGIIFIIGLICYFVVVGLHYQTGSGEHTGYVTAVEKTGIFFKTDTVYIKTDPQSSQEDAYCVVDSSLYSQLASLSENKTQVTVKYISWLISGAQNCNNEPAIITSVVTTEQEANSKKMADKISFQNKWSYSDDMLQHLSEYPEYYDLSSSYFFATTPDGGFANHTAYLHMDSTKNCLSNESSCSIYGRENGTLLEASSQELANSTVTDIPGTDFSRLAVGVSMDGSYIQSNNLNKPEVLNSDALTWLIDINLSKEKSGIQPQSKADSDCYSFGNNCSEMCNNGNCYCISKTEGLNYDPNCNPPTK